MQIISALETATAHQIVCLSICMMETLGGVTRLLALCAGAVYAGSPMAIAFLGYGQIYKKTLWLARPTSLCHRFQCHPLLRSSPDGDGTPEVQRYLSDPEYVKRGEDALSQFVMHLCAQNQFESPPAHLTLGRLNESLVIAFAVLASILEKSGRADCCSAQCGCRLMSDSCKWQIRGTAGPRGRGT